MTAAKRRSTKARDAKPKRKPATQAAGEGRTDWKRVANFTDAEIERMARDDLENPITTGGDWADAWIGPAPYKQPVNANYDSDVVRWFKSHGRGYQSHMNNVLRHYMNVQRRKRPGQKIDPPLPPPRKTRKT